MRKSARNRLGPKAAEHQKFLLTAARIRRLLGGLGALVNAMPHQGLGNIDKGALFARKPLPRIPIAGKAILFIKEKVTVRPGTVGNGGTADRVSEGKHPTAHPPPSLEGAKSKVQELLDLQQLILINTLTVANLKIV